MKISILFIVVVLAGCVDTEENASANLKKGDDFFAKKEYEVAEYYYERIPEASPFYNKAQRKLDEIGTIKRQWVEKEITAEELAKIIILEHTYKVDNITRVPIHRLSLVNNMDRILEYIEVEFSYFNKDDRLVHTLVTETRTPMFQKTQDVFTKIEPGSVPVEFSRSTARILKARYQ
jgi:hypothetical protein